MNRQAESSLPTAVSGAIQLYRMLEERPEVLGTRTGAALERAEIGVYIYRRAQRGRRVRVLARKVKNSLQPDRLQRPKDVDKTAKVSAHIRVSMRYITTPEQLRTWWLCQ